MSQVKTNYGALTTLITVFFFWGFIAAGNSVFIPFCKHYFHLDQFQSQLIDFDVASNYGNWAYIAGVGNATRTPRFNTEFQQQKYDPTKAFIRRWMSSETTEK